MEIKQIKHKLSILTVLKHYSLRPDKNQMLSCPFHEDDRPSLKIYPETGTFHCFGCGVSGDQIEFIQQKEQLNKHEAILKAKSLFNGSVQTSHQPVKPKKQENHTEIISKIFSSFKNGLHSPVSKKPKEYLKERHLDYTQLEAGYNSGQFHHRGKLSRADTKACIAAGLLIPYGGKTPNAGEQSYTPFAKDCIIFPLKNRKGDIVSLYGRSITEKGGKHFYLKNRSGLYPEYPSETLTKLILTESVIDAATLLQDNYIHSNFGVLSCYGVNGLTDEHRRVLSQLKNLEEIIFFFDGDQAGREAVEKYAKELTKALNCKVSKVETPENEDINSLLDGHEPKIFKHLIESRKTFFLLSEKKEIEIPTKNSEAVKNQQISTSKNHHINTSNPDYILFTTGDLKLTVLGGINMNQLDRLRVTLKINADRLSVRNNIDLYNIDQCDRFTAKAAEKLEIGTSTLNQAISELTDQLENYRLSKLEAQKTHKSKERELTPEREKRALKYLKQKDLLKRTNEDIGRAGIIGEENNRLLMYLVFTSRLREQPLHIISLGGSGTGKTYLQEKISELIPEHHKKEITILSENAFYYFEKTELKNKLVLIEDMDGAESVLYPLRELQSKRKISKTVPIKDPKGNLKTITLNVEGPICLAGTTTRERLYEDNANRSLLIYLDSRKAHKEQIMSYQRKLSAGKIDSRQEQEIKELFKDIQTVLKPVKVINPYAEQLKIPQHVFKPLRTNSHYLAFIETVTFYKQYQRKLHTHPETGEKYIRTELEDIEEANRLIKDVLLAKSDELSNACRRFFENLKTWLKQENKTGFYAKEIRESFRMPSTSCNRYILELLRNNYIKIVGGNKYRKGYEYEVLKYEEYKQLQAQTQTVLDEVLEKIKQSVSRYPTVSQN